MFTAATSQQKFTPVIPQQVPYLETLLRDLNSGIQADHLFISVLKEAEKEAATLYYFSRKTSLANFIYSLADSPCAEVFHHTSSSCVLHQNSYQRFPFTNFPCSENVEVYLGIPIFDDNGVVLGILVALFYQHREVSASDHALMQMTSRLIAEKIERYNQPFASAALQERHTQEQELPLPLWDELDEPLVLFCPDAKIYRVNLAFTVLMGYSNAELEGKYIGELLYGPRSSENISWLQEIVTNGPSGNREIKRYLALRTSSGRELQVELTISGVSLYARIMFLLKINDISQQIEANETIYHMAYYDPITQAKNRNCFEHDMRQLLRSASEQNRFIYCALVDIDNLNKLNLNFGLEGGNYCIRFVARRLRQLLSAEFQVYKCGIDSFFLLHRESFAQASPNTFVRPTLENNLLLPRHYALSIKQKKLVLSLSLGSGMFKAKNYNYEALVNALEYAKNESKKQAPSGHFYMGQSIQLAFQRQSQVREHLYHAIDKQEFSLVFQPQYTNRGDIAASEALLRWHCAELGDVSPDEFIPIAESSGVIFEIGHWVINCVCQTIQQCNEEGIHTRVAINVSGKQIMHPGFKQDLVDALEHWQVSASSLILELTETSLVDEIEQLSHIMSELSELGFELSIDDFGTGYSSLSYLKVLPISELKIDRYFVKDINDNTQNSSVSIIQLIINMARILKVKTVAEGVETQHQLAYLRDIHCDMYQGYLFASPMSKAEWRKLLKADTSCVIEQRQVE